MRKSIALLALLPLFLLAGCGTLQTGGVYSDQQDLYRIDATINLSYEVIHTFVTWEMNSRPVLTARPEITKAADRMRIGAPKWFGTAFALRDAYAAAPNDGTKSALETSLAVLQAAMAEATRYMAESR